ncbi:tripartite tricarboxylate transporter TctB family protein [Virgibacillus necropolis]|nr:tripartite tricarboxylate transporter TctB family protein [Virgibacillus necropolis]
MIIIIPYEVRSSGEEALGPRFFPYMLSIIIILLSIISIFEKEINENKKKDKKLKKIDYFRLLYVLIGMVAWVFLAPLIGFILSTVVFTASVMYIVGNRKLFQLIFIPLILTAVLYYVFTGLLNVFLP